MGKMSPLLREAVDRVSELPAAVQNRIARHIIGLDPLGLYGLDDEERAAIAEADAQIERGELLTDDEVAALFHELEV